MIGDHRELGAGRFVPLTASTAPPRAAHLEPGIVRRVSCSWATWPTLVLLGDVADVADVQRGELGDHREPLTTASRASTAELGAGRYLVQLGDHLVPGIVRRVSCS